MAKPATGGGHWACFDIEHVSSGIGFVFEMLFYEHSLADGSIKP